MSWCPTTSWAASSRERLDSDDTARRGYILDGFPRTVPQAVLLHDITVEDPLDLVIDLVVPTEVVLERLAARRVCSDCGANYSVDSPPKYGWVCDNCGGEVIQRADDTPDAIQKRLDLYERETQPLIAWYSRPQARWPRSTASAPPTRSRPGWSTPSTSGAARER